VGNVPFDLKFALKVTHPFEKRQLRPISVYNVSTVRANEKVQLSRIGSRPRAFQRAIDEVRTLPPTPQRMAQKANLLFSRIKFATKFFVLKCSATVL